MRKILALVLIAFTLSGCQACSRKYGGDMTYKIPADRVFVNVTWKDNDLWVLTRPRTNADATRTTYRFDESSNLGVLEGSVTIIEE